MEHGLYGWNGWTLIFLIRFGKGMNTDSFGLSFSLISTALFSWCVMPTVGDISSINRAIWQWNANDSSPPPDNYRDSPMRKGEDSVENLLKRAFLNTELVKPAYKKRCLLRHLSTLLMLIILLQPIYWHYGIKTHDKHVFWQNEPAILHWSFWYRSLWVLQNIQIYFHPKNECLTLHLHNKIP